jgi:sigma-B regulation protein RsbU (phosphoserine phosphatase)
MVRSLNSCPNDDPRDIIQKVADGISRFVADAEQFDDITMLCFRFDGDDAKMLELDAKRENLDEVLDFVDGYLEAKGCSLKVQMQIDIAVEEIFVNIAHYAYAPRKGKATVRVEVSEDPVTVTITFLDHGVPFDPLAKADPDLSLDAEERKIGGLGIFLTRQFMDDVAYAYKNGQNILTLKKKLG